MSDEINEPENPEVADQPNQETEQDNHQEQNQNQDDLSGPENKYKRDLLKFKDQTMTLKQQNEELQKKLRQNQEQAMAEKGRYKELYEQRNQEYESLQQERQRDRDAFFNSLKQREIEKEAMRLGIRKEALQDLSLLDNNNVIVETTSTGNVNIVGAKEFVEDIRNTRGYWFDTANPPKVNSGNPEFKTETITPQKLLELQKKNPAEYKRKIKEYQKQKYSR